MRKFLVLFFLILPTQSFAIECPVSETFTLEVGKDYVITAQINNSPVLEYNVEKRIDLAKQQITFEITSPVQMTPPPPPGLFPAKAIANHLFRLEFERVNYKAIFVQETNHTDCSLAPIYPVKLDVVTFGL
jgi:hypothetical protein